MKRSRDSDDDTLITRGVLLVGSGVLFAHVLFPFIWWNFMGGSAYYSNPQMIYGIPTNYRVVTYTPVLRATATVTVTTTVIPGRAGGVEPCMWKNFCLSHGDARLRNSSNIICAVCGRGTEKLCTRRELLAS